MAEKCSCGHRAHGAIGTVKMCRYCISAMVGRGQSEFRSPVTLNITNENGSTFKSQWVPWSFTKEASR